MNRRILIVALVWLALSGVSWAQNYGQSDTLPSTYVNTDGRVQVRYNVKVITVTDMSGATHPAYSYDYSTIDKLDKESVEKELSPAAAGSIKAAPLKAGKELVVGYNGMDKAAYEAKFNAEEKP